MSLGTNANSTTKDLLVAAQKLAGWSNAQLTEVVELAAALESNAKPHPVLKVLPGLLGKSGTMKTGDSASYDTNQVNQDYPVDNDIVRLALMNGTDAVATFVLDAAKAGQGGELILPPGGALTFDKIEIIEDQEFNLTFATVPASGIFAINCLY